MNAIELKGAGKRYWKLEEQAMLLKSVLPFRRPKRHELWALRDVDLAVAEGEVLGILGRNGAGKTTLLRMLAGVTRPSAGEITIRGRVAPLIGVGVGFHAEMSGRENVYVNGLLLGLTKAQLDERFESIVEFAELEEFIDTPVKFYSSGMFMRLGFSVAVHTDPQVLLVDEILAVGDISFQLKCYERMREIRERGTTLLVVSHSMQAIQMLCQRTAVFSHGRLRFDGPTEGAIDCHYRLLEEEGGAGHEPRSHTHAARIVAQELLGPDGPSRTFSTGQPIRLRSRLAFDSPVDDPVFMFRVLNHVGVVVYGLMTPMRRNYRTFARGEEVEVEIALDARLEGGSYTISTSVTSSDGSEIHYTEQRGSEFYMTTRAWSFGIANLDGRVLVDGEKVVDERDHSLDGSNDDPISRARVTEVEG